MALSVQALSTTPKVETFLGLASGTDTALIEIFIDSATAFLEGIVQRKLKLRTYTDFRLDGNGYNIIQYPEYPLNTVTALVIEDSRQTIIKTVDTTLANKKLLINREVGEVILMEDIFVTGNINIKTTFTAGYNSSNIDDEVILDMLETACHIMVQHLYMNKGLQDQFLESEKIGNYSYTRAIPKPRDVTESFGALPTFIQRGILALKRV